MKNLSVYFLFLFLAFLTKSGNGQLVTPEDEVCPGETVEYTIKSSYYGETQAYRVINGVFVMADSVYYTQGDSTAILLEVSSSNNKITIRWDDDSDYGTLRWYDQSVSWVDQDFVIGLPVAPTIQISEIEVLSGVQTFTIEVTELNASSTNLYYEKSSNIQYISRSVDDSFYEEWDILVWEYNFQINNNLNGWVKFRSQSSYPGCSSHFSNWTNINVIRKLASPDISENNNKLCDSNQLYTISSSDPNSETFTWTTTNGLKIYKNGQYLTTYTGTETSLTLSNQSSIGVLANLKVKANAQDFADSDETVLPVWLGNPNPNDFWVEATDNYGKSTFVVCENQCYTFYLYPIYNTTQNHHRYNITDVDFYFDFNYSVVTSGFGWVYVCVNNIDEYSAGVVYVDACDNNIELLDFEVEEGCGGGYYYMSYSPNPANEYLEISLTEEANVKEKQNKLKIKKNKYGDFEEYSIKILDKNGVVRKSVQSEEKNVNISTRNLEPGTYYIHLNYNKETYKQQIIIE